MTNSGKVLFQMIYIKINWRQKNPLYPITLYSEMNEERHEVRKIEIFSDGSSFFASESKSTGSTILGELPLPSFEEIAGNSEFEPCLISKNEFELAWNKAITQPGPMKK